MSNPSVIELNIAMICSCMPAFKPFLQHYAPWLRSVSSRILSSKGKLSAPSDRDSASATATATKASATYSHTSSSDPASEKYMGIHDEENPPYETHQAPKQKIMVETRVMSESTERIV